MSRMDLGLGGMESSFLKGFPPMDLGAAPVDSFPPGDGAMFDFEAYLREGGDGAGGPAPGGVNIVVEGCSQTD